MAYSNQTARDYKEIIEEVGLANYKELRVINFIHGVMRYAGEEMSSFVTSENDIYYEADFDLEKRSARTSNGESLVIPITEIEYQEKYLEEIKKTKQAS